MAALPDESFGQQLRRMRESVLMYEDWNKVSLTQEHLWTCLGLRGDYKSVARWENDSAVPKRDVLLLLVRFFAGMPGCLETHAAAQQWAEKINLSLEPGQLSLAFTVPTDDEGVELGIWEELWKAKQAALRRLLEAPPPSTLTMEQRSAYLYLLTKAYGQWAGKGIYVPQEAEELRRAPEPPAGGRGPRRSYDAALRSYDYVYEQAGMQRRERLQTGLLDWFLEKRHLALLAVPGCGKSTALEEMAGELAVRQLRATAAEDRLPVLISLGDYSDGSRSVAEWLSVGAREALRRALVGWSGLDQVQAEADAEEEIRRSYEPLADHLDGLRDRGKLFLLVDGLNELPGGADGFLRPSVNKFVAEARQSGNLVAVACRRDDYRSAIGDLHRIELLPFDDERIHQAVLGHVGEEESKAEATRVWEQLVRPENSRLREVLAIPLYVEVFSKSLERDGTGHYCLPANRGELLDRFARTLLARERERAVQAGRAIPDLLVLHAALAEMAYGMRAELGSHGSTRELSDVHALLVRALIGQFGAPNDCLNLASGGLISLDRTNGKISFWKEPIEEVFAARHLLARFADGYLDECQALWRVPLKRGDPRLADDRTAGEAPPYPNTDGAWEQTTILAAGLAGSAERRASADKFVQAVLAVNPWLAGRCIHEGGAQVSDAVRAQVQQTLLDVLQDRDYSVRVRVPCGVLLGELGDQRFHGKELFCLPREELLGFIRVPAGPFIMGSDQKTVDRWNDVAEKAIKISGLYNGELYGRKQELPDAYLIARYPVTNAQFRCFVEDEDGGYPRWDMDYRSQDWTSDGLKWVLGDHWSDALEAAWRDAHRRGLYKDWDDEDNFIENGVKPHLRRLRKDGPAAEYWSNPDYNPPNQPVVGVTWYEAVAYANWLHRKLLQAEQCPPELRRLLENGLRVRLPSEPEWEKAARGGLKIPGHDGGFVDNPQARREWSWEGDWDSDRCNTAEGAEAVRWLSPAGMFPDGASPYGCLDMIGTVWEWTRSRYASYPYPADEAGRRDREDPENIGSPVLRGGSWGSNRRNARCAVRGRHVPAIMYNYLGLRLVVSLSASGS